MDNIFDDLQNNLKSVSKRLADGFIENFDVDVYFEIILRFDKNGYDYSVNLIPILQIKVKNEINDYGRFKIFMEKLIQHYEVEYPNLIKDKFSLHTEINKQNFDDKITEINKLLYKLSQQLDLKFTTLRQIINKKWLKFKLALRIRCLNKG
jgi:hypothetical protein